MASKENGHLKYLGEPKYDPTSPTTWKPATHTPRIAITAPTKTLSSFTSTTVQSNRTTPSLTATALAVHDVFMQTTDDKEKRILKLQKAAQDLGFELPRRCFKSEKWGLNEWIKEQRNDHDGKRK